MSDSVDDCLVVSFGNVSQHAYSCNGGSRLILGYMNAPVKNLNESTLDQLPENLSRMNNQAATDSVYPDVENKISYTYIDCTKEANISFTIDLLNTPAGLVTTVYMVPMNFKIENNLYNNDPLKNNAPGTPPYYADRIYADKDADSISPTPFNDGTYVTCNSLIHSNYTNGGEAFVYYDDNNTTGYTKSIIKWLDQYRSSDDIHLNLDKNMGDEFGFGYNDAQGLGMGSSIEIDLMEATPCSCAVTLHGLCNPAGYDNQAFMRPDLSTDYWTEYDKYGYGGNIHCGILIGQTIYTPDVRDRNSLTFEEVNNSTGETKSTVLTEGEYIPTTYGPLNSKVRTSFDDSITKYRETKDATGFFINSLLPFDVKCVITPSEPELITLTATISQVYESFTHKAIFVICSGGFPTTTQPQENGVAVQERTQNLDKMNIVIANWCTSPAYKNEPDLPLNINNETFKTFLTKDNSKYDYKVNTTSWLDGSEEEPGTIVGSSKITRLSNYNFRIGTTMTIRNVLAGETLVLNTPDQLYWLYMTASTGSDLTWTIPQGAFLSNGSDTTPLVAGDYIIKTFNNLTSNVFTITEATEMTASSEYNFLIGTPMTISNVPSDETLVLNTSDGSYWLYMTASTGSDLTWTIPQGAELSNGSDTTPLVAGDYIIKTFNNLTSNTFTITEATEMTASSEYNFRIGTPMTITNVPSDETLVLNTSDGSYWLYMTASTGGDLTWTIPQGAFLSNGSETTPLVAGNYIIKTFNNLTSNTFAITEATPTPSLDSFHLTPQMDDFYENGTDQVSNIASHVICSNNCWLALGSNGTFCSSEALSYGLDFYSEKYMISNNIESITTIIQIINTILNLSVKLTAETGDSTSPFRNLILPCWKFNPNESLSDIVIFDLYSAGSATDSNIEILTAMLKLYLFDDKYPRFSTITCNILYQCTILGKSFNKTDSLKTVLKNMIDLFAFNLLGDNNFTNASSAPFFSLSCKNVSFTNTDSLKEKRMSDYINYICYIYLQHYFSTNNPDNFTATINGTSYTMPTLDKTKAALDNYLVWIHDAFKTNTSNMPYELLGDNVGPTYNRMSYHLVALFTLLKKGDTRLGLGYESCKNYWLTICSKDITYISDLCKTLILYEYNATADDVTYPASSGYKRVDTYYPTSGLSLKMNDEQTLAVPYVINPESINTTYAVKFGADGFYRQLSYKIFETLNGSFLTKRTPANGFYFFEQYTLNEYFGLNGDKTIPNTLQGVLDNYEEGVNMDFKFFSQRNTDGSSYYGWVDGCVPWVGNNDPYFMFSVCTLHTMNYLLYLGV